MAEEAVDSLFFGVSVTVLPGDDLPDAEADHLRQLLQDNGATFIPLLADGRIDDITQHSHIVSTHVDFSEYQQALELNCHVVRPTWVTQSIHKERQAQPRQHSPDPALIFREVVVTCADLPSGDSEAIIAGVIALGGMHSSPLTKLVTHVVSLSEDNHKVKGARSHGLDCKVVLPHWFDDCIKLGKKISERPYVLPDPDLLNDQLSTTRYPTPHANPDLAGATSALPGPPPQPTPPFSSPPTTPSSLRKKLNVFSRRAVYFSRDLNVNDRLARTLTDMVLDGRGTVTDSVHACDLYIGMYRDGLEYVTASRQGKDVANLAWFYNVIARNKWLNPLSKLLHYPVPRDGIPGFKGLKISLSNYSGEARLYLENLSSVAGAEFTKTMKQDNTHLITAHKASEKCEAAQEWNINIVNHLWLEESYAKCQVQSLTNTRYTHFPKRTNLGEVVGQTAVDLASVKRVYFSEKALGEQSDSAHDDGAQPPTSTKPLVSLGSIKIPSQSAPRSSSAKVKREHQVREGSTSSIDEGQHDDDQDRDTPVPQQRLVLSKATTERNVSTPAAVNKRLLDGKENDQTPSTGRSSKQKAMLQLHKASEDIALFQKEMRRKGGVTHGRKRNKDEADDDVSVGTTTNGFGDHNVDDKANDRAVKRAKQTASDLPVIKYKMLVSGDERWSANPKKEAEDKKTLRSLGIRLVTSPAECDLLCAPRILRTKKFLVALANAPEVVNTKYLDYALRHQALHDTSQYALHDRDNEIKLNIRLSESLERARMNAHKLLRGWTVYVTHNITAGYETFKDVIEINGGTAVAYRGRTGMTLPRARLRRDEDPDAGAESQHQGGDEECDFVYLVSSIADDEVKLWATFRKMARKPGLKARIVRTDWLLNLAMAQKVEWNDSWELTESAVPGWRPTEQKEG